MSSSHDASAHAAMAALMSPDRDLNQTDRAVYAYLVYRANGLRLCWKKMEEIQADLNIGTRRTVSAATHKLQEKKLIEIRHRRRDSNHYRILDPGGLLYGKAEVNGAEAPWAAPEAVAEPIQDVVPDPVQELALDGKETAHQEPQAATSQPVDGKDSVHHGRVDGKDSVHHGRVDGKDSTQESVHTDKRNPGKDNTAPSRACARAGGRATEPPGFDEWYRLYPRKDAGRKATITAYAKALTETTPAGLLDGLERYRFSPDPEKIPMATTWLNQGRWTCEYRQPNGKLRDLDPSRLTGFAAIMYRNRHQPDSAAPDDASLLEGSHHG